MEVCQYCILVVKRKILDKNRSIRKTISIENFRHWVKSLRQISKLYFLHPAEKVAQKVVHLKEILALYHFWDLNKNTRQVFQTCTRGVKSEIFKKKLLSSGRNNFLTSLVTKIQKKRLGCQTCLLGSRRTNSTKTCYLKKKHDSLFFLLWANDFQQNWEPPSTCPEENFRVFPIETLLSYHHSRILSKKSCEMFSETFWAWFSELNSTCPEENFHATHFLEKSDFYNQLGTSSDTMKQLLATWVSVFRSEVHSMLPVNFLKLKSFWTNVKRKVYKN